MKEIMLSYNPILIDSEYQELEKKLVITINGYDYKPNLVRTAITKCACCDLLRNNRCVELTNKFCFSKVLKGELKFNINFKLLNH